MARPGTKALAEEMFAEGGGAATALERLAGWLRGAAAPAVRWDAAVDATISLRPGRRGLVLTCRTGTFLVTQAGDPLDHVLERGDSFRAGGRGRLAVWALRAGSLDLQGAPAPADR